MIEALGDVLPKAFALLAFFVAGCRYVKWNEQRLRDREIARLFSGNRRPIDRSHP